MADTTFDSVMAELDAITKKMDAYVADEVKPGKVTVEVMLATFIKIRSMNDRIGEVKKHLNAVKDHMAYTVIPERFQDDGIKTITMDELGVRVSTSAQIRASIKGGLKDEAFGWLREHKLGGIITETVNASTLSAQCKDMMKNGEELPENFFNVNTALNTSVTKVKK